MIQPARILPLLMLPLCALAQPQPAELLSRLSSDDAATRKQAWESAAQYGPAAIVTIAPLLDDPRHEVARAAQLALEYITGAASGAADTRRQAADALVVAVISVKKKDWLFYLLSVVGNEDSLEPLLALLRNHPEHGERALMTIESLVQQQDAEGRVALLEQDLVSLQLLELLPQLPAPQQVAVVNTLGAVRAAAAVSPLMKLAEADEPLRKPALEALGHIGGEDASELLMKSWRASHDGDVLNALLRALETVDAKQAEKQYLALLKLLPPPDAAEAPTSEQAAAQASALTGLGRSSQSQRTATTLIAYLESSRADTAGAARNSLIAASGGEVTPALVKALNRAAPAVKIVLLEILTQREPAAAESHLRAALEDPDETVRTAAQQLLDKAF